MMKTCHNNCHLCIRPIQCPQATGLGGTVSRGHDSSKIEDMQTVTDRIIKVRFNADVASSMMWNFKPQQTDVKVGLCVVKRHEHVCQNME